MNIESSKMSVTVIELPQTFSITLEDGTVLDRFRKPQYCYSTGFKDLDEFFELDKAITGHVANPIQVITSTTTSKYYLHKDCIKFEGITIPIDENSLSKIMNNENKFKDLPVNYHEHEDELLKVIFEGLVNNKIRVIIYVKTLNTLLILSLKLKDLKHENETYETLITRWGEVFLDLKCVAAIEIFKTKLIFVDNLIGHQITCDNCVEIRYYVLIKGHINEKVDRLGLKYRLEKLIEKNKLVHNYDFPANIKKA